MAIIDPKTAHESEVLQRFGGIKSFERLSSSGAFDMRNFRILPDGSLEKRCGFRKWFSLPAPIRGVWEGEIEGDTYFFAVSGNTVFHVTDNGAAMTTVYVLSTSEGPVRFVYYADLLYLFDGKEVVRYRPSSNYFTVAEGYTPLYGKNWHPTYMGEVNEPLNLIQNRIRIHYLNSSGDTTFRLPYSIKQINRVTVNGSATTGYIFNSADLSVTVSAATMGSSVEICATLSDAFNRRGSVLKSYRAIAYRDSHHETLLCCGGTPGYFVYHSAPVSQEMLDACKLAYQSSDPLYIPENGVLCVGSAQHPITAICQNGEQVLVLNDRTLWAIRHVSEQSADMRIYLLRTDIGCSAPDGLTVDGGSPIVVNESGIYRLDFLQSDPSACSVTCLSNDVFPRLNPEILQSAIPFHPRGSGELWLASPSDENGTVRVRDTEQETWVIYDGIRASLFFERKGILHFATVFGDICFMDESLDTDDDSPIAAYYQSHYLPFSHPVAQKRALHATLCANTEGAHLTLSLETDRGEKSRVFYGKTGDLPELFKMRMASGRFRFLRFRVSSCGSERVRIHSLSFSANH